MEKNGEHPIGTQRLKRLKNKESDVVPMDESANVPWQEEKPPDDVKQPSAIQLANINTYTAEVENVLADARKNGQHNDIDDDLKVRYYYLKRSLEQMERK